MAYSIVAAGGFQCASRTIDTVCDEPGVLVCLEREGWAVVTETAASAPGTSEFGMVPWGYDRGQVDAHLQVLAEQVAELRMGCQRECRRAESAEEQLHHARTELARRDAACGEDGESAPTQGFGYRVEKLLRAAENEAGEVRSAAVREANALMDRARGSVEAQRYEMEQSLISRSAALDQEVAQRRVALDERERQVTEQTAAAKDEAERMLTQARQQCDQLWLQARARAERERATAADAVRERRRLAEQELGRLHRLHDQIRGQLIRLLDSLKSEFGATNPASSSPPQPDSPTQPSSPVWPDSSVRPDLSAQPDSPTQPVWVLPHRAPAGPESPSHPVPYPRSGRGRPVSNQKNADQKPGDWLNTPPSEAVTNDELRK